MAEGIGPISKRARQMSFSEMMQVMSYDLDKMALRTILDFKKTFYVATIAVNTGKWRGLTRKGAWLKIHTRFVCNLYYLPQFKFLATLLLSAILI